MCSITSLLPTSGLEGRFKDVMTSSGQALNNVEGIVTGDPEKPPLLPHWSVLVLGANALLQTISAIAQGVIGNIAACIVNAIAAGTSIVACITIWVFTPLKSLQGYVEALSTRIQLMTQSVNRLGATQAQLRTTVEEQKKTIADQKKQFDEQDKKLQLNAQTLDKAAIDLTATEKGALSFNKLIDGYSAKTKDWGVKLNQLLTASQDAKTNNDALALQLKTLQDEDKAFSEHMAKLTTDSNTLKTNAQTLEQSSQDLRGAALKLTSLFIAIRKEQEAANKQIDDLTKAQQAVSNSATQIKNSTDQLVITESAMKEHLKDAQNVAKLAEMLKQIQDKNNQTKK